MDAKAHSTILAFAFTTVQHRSWEFTHKSFGEALASEAIGRLLEDVSESGRYGERWKVSLPNAAKSWIETFGPHFLTKDLLDFCTGWLQTTGPEFCEGAVPRLVEILSFLLGVSAAEQVSAVAQSTERPLHAVLGNACRSWFSLTNATLGIIVDAHGRERLAAWRDRLDQEQFRTAAFLSHLASPVGFGESGPLFSWTASLMEGKKGPSRRYRRALATLLSGLKYRDRNVFVSMHGQDLRPLEEVLIHSGAEFSLVIGKGDVSPRPSLPTPIEAILAELEDTIQRGFERNPVQDATERTGVDLPDLRDPDNRKLGEYLLHQLRQSGPWHSLDLADFGY